MPADIARQFGANLREARPRSGLSQEEVGWLASLHRTEIGLLETGARTPPIDALIKLAAALGINVDYLAVSDRTIRMEIEGIPLKDWPLHELRRRHTLALVDHMLRVEGRATTGAVGILRALSAMAEDAITDEVCDLNLFKGVRIRANDPRAQKKPRPIRVFSFEEMHRFAKAAGRYEATVRVFTDTGLRLGEVFPSAPRRLRRRDPPSPPHRPRGPNPRGNEDRPRRARRRPRRPCAGDPGLDARSPDPAKRRGLRPPLHDPTRSPMARAHVLPRPLEARPRSLGPRHPPPRVSPLLRDPPPRRRHQ